MTPYPAEAYPLPDLPEIYLYDKLPPAMMSAVCAQPGADRFKDPWARAGGMLLAEISRAHLGLELGLSTAVLGESLVETPLRLVASLAGPHGLSFLVLVIALLGRKAPWLFALPLASLAAPLPKPEGSSLAVLVQAGTPVEVKLQGIDLGSTYRLLTGQPSGLVVWSETSTASPPSYPSWIGGVETGGSSRAVWVEKGSPQAWRDKALLTPFAEGLPYIEALGGFYRLLGLQQERLKGELRPLGPYGVLVCSEGISPLLARRLALEGAKVLVLLSNDGWFDGTPFKEYRLAQDRLRAVETGRWLLRAAETGPTVLVDPLGTVRARFLGERGSLTVRYGFREGLIPYARLNDLPVLFAALLLLGSPLLSRRR